VVPERRRSVRAKGVALAVAGNQRIDALPDTPTTTEAGLPEYKVNGWFAACPGGTPKPILRSSISSD
jgi:tripartite-type tricarboxylate transporter receptor subunit TctC